MITVTFFLMIINIPTFLAVCAQILDNKLQTDSWDHLTIRMPLKVSINVCDFKFIKSFFLALVLYRFKDFLIRTAA